ncbi:hypothetical protein ED352_08905 [Muribaculaceae bacterium Isolate-002 (NCI)]|nr:hypothetical protein ED352_08905 [Muribaculaceae bacterium Isolate-002 (NCI)]
MKLFDRDGNGSEEITAAVGIISNGITFDKWRPLLHLGVRDVVAIVGREPVEALARFYNRYEVPDDEFPQQAVVPLRYLQQAVAFFTWLKLIPTLDAQHGDAGRAKNLGENEKGLTALQEFKDEENILRLAYEATDALVEALDREAFPFWIESPKYRQREGLLIRSKEEFDNYYIIGSHRLFVTLVPIIREVQGATVAPVLGKYLAPILSGEDSDTFTLMKATAARAVALLTMQKAVERLPVEVIPEGIVQVQQSQPVKSRLRAEQSARASVAASLGADATRALEYLQQLVAQLDADGEEVDTSITGPIVHSKGMSF